MKGNSICIYLVINVINGLLYKNKDSAILNEYFALSCLPNKSDILIPVKSLENFQYHRHKYTKNREYSSIIDK